MKDGYIKNDEVVEFTVDDKGTIAINKKEVEEIKYENIDGSHHLGWVIDKEMPILKGEKREYVDRLVYVGE